MTKLRSSKKITLDFETRSECDLGAYGAWAYSRDPTTDIICMAYKIPGQSKKLWNRTSGVVPLDLFEAIEKGYLVEAHNMFFELCVWTNVGVKKYNWPELPLEQLSCSAAKAAMHALPRSLEGAGKALNLDIQKASIGKALINKLSKPQKPTKKDSRIWLNEDDTELVTFNKEEITVQQLFQMFYDYCLVDIGTEEELSESLDDLTEIERKIWLLDQLINIRGLYVDIDLVEAALGLLEYYETKVNTDILELTDGFVDKPTKRNDIMFWCWLYGTELPDLTADTIEKLLKEDTIPEQVRKILRLRQIGGGTATKKFIKFKQMADPDDHRIRGSLLYHGATTGRWAGKGIQPQNLVKGTLKTVEDIEECISIIKQRNIKVFDKQYGEDPIGALASVVRSIISASPGYDMFVADYSAIEARIIVWLAKDETALDIFRDNGDIYMDMASTIFNVPVVDLDRDKHRPIGKDAILGLGYGMGWTRFQRESFEKGGRKLSSDFCEGVIDKYRKKYSSIVKLWNATEKAAIYAVEHNRGKDHPCIVGYLKFYMHNGFLCVELPSGRCIHYHKPAVIKSEWYGKVKKKLTYYGPHPKTKQHTKRETYGGHLVENICQAVARDVMAYAALEAEAEGYITLTTIHDELVSEKEEGTGDIREYEKILCRLPAWAEGCPIDAEGWVGKRYRK